MEDEYNLNRFLKAQEDYYEIALKEIKDGNKQSHWIWFIFPQLSDLGYSSTAKYYGIKNLEEAKAYLENDILKSRLIEISTALYKNDDNITNILGYPDNLKLKSCMTLFNCANPEIDIFKKIIDKYYEGEYDKITLELLKDYEKNVNLCK